MKGRKGVREKGRKEEEQGKKEKRTEVPRRQGTLFCSVLAPQNQDEYLAHNRHSTNIY